MVDAALVTAAAEFGVKEGGYAGLGQVAADDPRAQRNHICVIVLAGKLRGERIVDAGAAAFEIAVDGDRNADARAAYSDPALGFAEPDDRTELRALGRVIDAVGTVGAEVGHLMTLLAQPTHKLVLQGVTGMVGGKSDVHAP